MDTRIARMIDANANRCREALRTMEDVARFGLNHGALAAEIKAIRHELRAALEALGGGLLQLIACRDTPNDAGVSNKTPEEGGRSGLRDIATAAGKRAGEALRTLEEASKAVSLAPESGSDAVWRRLERLRYRLYECEKRLTLALGSGLGKQWRLCVLVTAEMCRLDWREVVRRSIEGGADCIQLREKSLASRDFEGMARKLRRVIGANADAAMIVNDRIDIALLSGADGVHLGQDDLSVESARRLASTNLIVGVSTHNLEEARKACAAGADYCGVGAMFPTGTKVRETSGPEYLRAYLCEPGVNEVPHLAIGGITPTNVGELVNAGCRGVAVSSVVCASERPEEVCAALRKAIDRNHAVA